MNIKTILKEVAPLIGSALGSPIAGMAVKLLGDKLLGDSESSLKDIEKRLLSGSPEDLIKLKKIDSEFKVKLIELGIDENKIHQTDRTSARQREMVLQDRMPAILSICLTGGFFGILILIIFCKIEPSTLNVLNVLLGSLATSWASVITYYFGSSHGSKIKTNILGGFDEKNIQ